MTQPLIANKATAIVDCCPFPLLLLNSQGEVGDYNQAFEQLVGESQASALRGKRYSTLDDGPLRALLGDEAIIAWEDKRDEPFHLEVHKVNLGDPEHTEARFFVDISEQVRLAQKHSTLSDELEQNIITDPATGLLNHRGAMLALEPQVARSRRYNSPLSVIMIELRTKDEGSRERTLTDAARQLKDQLRWADLIACTGPEEFTLVLPETELDAALQLAEKIMERLQYPSAPGDEGHAVWASFGVTGWRRNDTATTLIKRAAFNLSQAHSGQSGDSVA